MALLEVENLSVEYVSVGQVNRALNDFSFSCEAGEVIGLVGESGSGKSTAMLALLGLVRAGARITGGSVRLEGRELLGLATSEWEKVRGVQIGLVTQNPRGALNPVMRVGAQIAAVYRAHFPDATKEAARERALDLLRIVGINDPERRLEAFPHELSGGMAQRVLIAMALSCTPRLLLADEPTSGLDVTVQAQVLDDLRAAVTEVGSSLVLVTQDLGIVANYCDRVYQLHAGELVEEASTPVFFDRSAHPASAALLMAQKSAATESFRLQGFPVDGRRLPSGCWLHPRCPFVDDAAGCRTVHPELLDAGAGHRVRCHRWAHVQQALGTVRGGTTAPAGQGGGT